MTGSDTMTERRFYRDADRALLGGVFAGIARHLGFNLCVTRILAVMLFFMTGPLTIVAYIAAVLLIPSESSRDGESPRRSRRGRRRRRRERREARRQEREQAEFAAAPRYQSSRRTERAEIIREKCEDLDQRLRRLEKHVTSRRFQIEQELSRL